MSVLVKNMSMPEDCDDCEICDIIGCDLWKSMDIGERHPCCPLIEVSDEEMKIEADEDQKIEINVYDSEEIHPNCTVQILRNSVTGEISVGWRENGKVEE